MTKLCSRKILFLILLGSCASLKPIPRFGAEPLRLRVLLSNGERKITISATGDYIVHTANEDFWLSNGAGTKIDLMPSAERSLNIWDRWGRRVDDVREPILIAPKSRQERIIWGQKQYRGRIRVSVNENGLLGVVNEVEIEDYLKGVVAAEMGEFGKTEYQALKAVAVAARSYAIRRMLSRRGLNFDLLATEDDQVYHGSGEETPYCSRAVEETRGMVALYQGRVINAFYHSSCGGRTEDAGNLWPEDDAPYLKSVVDSFDGKSFFCKDSPDFRWVEVWERLDLEEMFKNALRSTHDEEPLDTAATLEDIRVVERFNTGRVRKLVVKLGGNTYTFRGDNIRRVLKRPTANGAILRSTLFVLHVVRDENGKIEKIIAIGGGNGHGVGLCQWGAVGMARKGFSYDMILKHYYQGIELKKIY